MRYLVAKGMVKINVISRLFEKIHTEILRNQVASVLSLYEDDFLRLERYLLLHVVRRLKKTNWKLMRFTPTAAKASIRAFIAFYYKLSLLKSNLPTNSLEIFTAIRSNAYVHFWKFFYCFHRLWSWRAIKMAWWAAKFTGLRCKESYIITLILTIDMTLNYSNNVYNLTKAMSKTAF